MFRNFPDIFVTDFSFNFIVIRECAVYSFNSFNLLRHYWLRRWSVLVCFMGSIKIYILLFSVNIDSFESAVQIFFVFAALSTYMFFQTLREECRHEPYICTCLLLPSVLSVFASYICSLFLLIYTFRMILSSIWIDLIIMKVPHYLW